MNSPMTPLRRWSRLTVPLALASTVLLAACASGGDPAAGTSTQTADPGNASQTDEAGSAGQDQLTAVKVNTLAFPSAMTALPRVITDNDIDEKHGIRLEATPFADIGAFYAAFTQGSVDAAVGGPTVFANLANEGADAQIICTYIGLAPEVVVATDPEIQSVADLEGKAVAATVASAQFALLEMYASSEGVDLQEDTDLVNGGLADVRTQLEAGRVDAGLLWEPAASPALAANEDWNVIYRADEAWTELTGEKGWELVWAMHRSFIDDNPGVVDQFIAMTGEAVEYMLENPDEAGAIMEDETGMPASVFSEILSEGRMDYEVIPAWDEEVTENLTTMLERGIEAGVIQSVPEDLIYRPGQ